MGYIYIGGYFDIRDRVEHEEIEKIEIDVARNCLHSLADINLSNIDFICEADRKRDGH